MDDTLNVKFVRI